MGCVNPRINLYIKSEVLSLYDRPAYCIYCILYEDLTGVSGFFCCRMREGQRKSVSQKSLCSPPAAQNEMALIVGSDVE